MAEQIKDASGRDTTTQDVSKGSDSAKKATATSEYRIIAGKHGRFEQKPDAVVVSTPVGGKPPAGVHKVYVVGDVINLTEEEAAALNRRGARIEPVAGDPAEVAKAGAEAELKVAQAKSAARDESGYSTVGPPGGAGGPGTPNEPVGGVPGKPGGPPLRRATKPDQDLPAGGARPDNSLPSGSARPDQGLPESGRPTNPIVEPQPEPKK